MSPVISVNEMYNFVMMHLQTKESRDFIMRLSSSN